MIVVPAIEAVAFWGLLRRPTSLPSASGSQEITSTTDDTDHELTNSASDLENTRPALNDDEQPLIGLKNKIKYVPKLFKYMIPLTLVYFLEYFINQGLVRAIRKLLLFSVKLYIYLFIYIV